MKIKTALCALLVFAAASTITTLPAASLKVGDPAPKLQTGKWVQGTPVKGFEKDKTYIVEFWATWCGPCRVSIPHLNEIHEKFKDKGLVVIGQDCWERDESLVQPFIEKMGEKMTYRVALDDKSDGGKGKMAETWMEAAGQNGIPSAFLVDKTGTIAWIGHPMTLKESMIEEVMAGTYDLKKAAAEAEVTQKNEAELMRLSRELSKAMQAKEWDTAEATLGKISPLLTEDQRGGLDSARLRIALMKEDYAAAGKLAEKLSAEAKEPMMKNQLAWMLATTKGIKGDALKAAAKIAASANEGSGGKDPAILDTLARVTWLQGQKEKAIELQKKAVDLAEDDMKSDLQQTLDSYKAGKLPNADE